ncbi:MAG: Stk1 family PASTA domain-containing Ser/Thr kinase [Eubacteriales Family XIII. Incertae Sedis bacterium]|nr:MAG: Stk1 family PASTA domain-containing Ser/Thr kinase [Clostridiales Family XIII bacterium]
MSRILAGRYELTEKIGEGGMAVVYKGRDRLLNRYVAIKILKPEFARDAKFIESFRRESQAAASLSHPNIVNIYDVGREGNIHYIVMELIEGSILSDLIKEHGALDWKRAVEITKQIARALSFAHANHIIHRDVKPHNIMITQSGTAKITDFGIAKVLSSSNVGENTGTVMGSVHYFSPEQARGGYIDEKSDIYSLGIVLYEMLTGKVPFDGENPVAVALMHINDAMTPPRELNPEIPLSVEAVVMKATDKIQINRYATADEMLKALDDAEFTEMIGNSSVPGGISETDTETEIDDNAETQENDGDAEATDMTGGAGKKKGKGNKGGKDRANRKILILAVVAALIVALPLSYGVVALVGNFTEGGFSGKGFENPDFRGLTLEQAEEKAAEYGLEIKEGDSVFSSEYEEGQISSQTPDVKAKVKKGNTVTVNVSKGAKEGTVPKIEGQTHESAILILEKYNFKVGEVTTKPSDQPEGIVLSQNPAAGEEARPGSSVSFEVSSGREEGQAIMPLLVGTDIDTAKTMLEENGLKPGNVTYERSTSYAKNQVIWQQYTAEDIVPEGTSVDLKVSSGDEDPEPVDISLYIDYSAAEDSVFWLTVTVSDEQGTHNMITREQRIKEDGGETVVLTGTGSGSVTVIFNNEVVQRANVNFNTGEIE